MYSELLGHITKRALHDSLLECVWVLHTKTGYSSTRLVGLALKLVQMLWTSHIGVRSPPDDFLFKLDELTQSLTGTACILLFPRSPKLLSL